MAKYIIIKGFKNMGRIIIFTREINGWEMLRPAKDCPCEGVVQAAQGMRDRDARGKGSSELDLRPKPQGTEDSQVGRGSVWPCLWE